MTFREEKSSGVFLACLAHFTANDDTAESFFLKFKNTSYLVSSRRSWMNSHADSVHKGSCRPEVDLILSDCTILDLPQWLLTCRSSNITSLQRTTFLNQSFIDKKANLLFIFCSLILGHIACFR